MSLTTPPGPATPRSSGAPIAWVLAVVLIGAAGAGVVVAVVGGVVGFKLKGSNSVSVERDRERRTTWNEGFQPSLGSVGVAPTRGGAMAGATFVV